MLTNSREQEAQVETHEATFWEKLEVWTSIPIPAAIQNHIAPEICDCGGDLKPTHWNPISGALYSEHDCPDES